MRSLCLVLLLGLVLGAPARAGQADDQFKAVYTKEWSWRQQQFGGYDDEDSASSPQAARLPEVGAKAQAARLAYWNDVLRQLDAIPLRELSAENQVNYAVYRPQVENLAASVRFRDYEMPFNSDSQFWSNLGFMTRRPLRDEAAVRAYIGKLDDVPRYFDEQIANMRAGLKRGFSVPRAVLAGRDVSIASYIEVKSPEDSDFYKPLRNLPATLPGELQESLRADARRAIRERVIPAYAKLLKFFRDEYVPKARKTLAAEAMPGGKAWYRQQIREYTTLDLDPEAIHRIGLDEVARIDAQMQATMRQTGFKGDFFGE